MRISTTNGLNLLAVAGIGAMMIAAGADYHGTDGTPGVDPITTASVQGAPAFDGDRFMAVNHRTNVSCIIALHRADGYDVHRIEPSQACAGLDDRIAQARAWQENGRGMVVVTDHRGNRLMMLMRGDGFAWEVVDPSHLQISLAAY